MDPSAPSAVFLVVLTRTASDSDHDLALGAARAIHPGASLAIGAGWSAIVVGDGVRPVNVEPLRHLSMVDRVVPVKAPYRFASREAFDHRLPVQLGVGRGGPLEATEIGGEAPIAVMVRCPAVLGHEEQLFSVAALASKAGATLLDAGRVPRGDGGRRDYGPSSALRELRAAADRAGMAVSVEVADAAEIEALSGLADVLQVGSRNMQDFSLLHELGRRDLPVLLKRGAGATIEEFLLAAEYVLANGNGRVILCESGIRTFDAGDQLRLQVSAIPVLRGATHLPVMVDVSIATGDQRLIPPVARAAIAAGADGVILEVTIQDQDPSLSAIPLSCLEQLVSDLRVVAAAVGRVA
jgi:3-deoxy-7-phosphoheptulonate synthase